MVERTTHTLLSEEEIRGIFDTLKTKWKESVSHHASYYQTNNPYYRAIIEMGEEAVPLMLGSLQKRQELWFGALIELTGENPIQEGHIGRPSLMAEDWIEWGIEKGYIDGD